MRLGPYLAMGFLCSLLALALFGWLAHGVVQDSDLVSFDREITQTLERHGQQHPEVRAAFRVVTEFGGPLVMSGGALVVVLVLVTKRHLLLALVWLIAVIGGGVLNEVLKMTFQRQRPTLELRSYSFPSGHAMNSLVFYGLLAYLLTLGMSRPWLRWPAAVALGLLVLAIGFSRMYLGVHWFTDVLAGYAAAAIWLAACITAIETVRQRKRF